MFKRLRSSLNQNRFNLKLQLCSMNHFFYFKIGNDLKHLTHYNFVFEVYFTFLQDPSIII